MKQFEERILLNGSFAPRSHSGTQARSISGFLHLLQHCPQLHSPSGSLPHLSSSQRGGRIKEVEEVPRCLKAQPGDGMCHFHCRANPVLQYTYYYWRRENWFGGIRNILILKKYIYMLALSASLIYSEWVNFRIHFSGMFRLCKFSEGKDCAPHV